MSRNRAATTPLLAQPRLCISRQHMTRAKNMRRTKDPDYDQVVATKESGNLSPKELKHCSNAHRWHSLALRRKN
jgi:hypothetical protein